MGREYKSMIARLAVFTRLLFLPLLFLLLLSSSVSPVFSQSAGLQDQKILVLHSYGPDYSWSISLNDGINGILDSLDRTNSIRYEYMDTKNIIGDEYYQKLVELFHHKYKDYQFDGILATDNNALSFLEQYGRELFGDIPIVATGINNASKISPQSDQVTIIPEIADHQTTLQQAFNIFPGNTDCYILVDSSATGHAIMEEVRQIEPLFSPRLTFHYIDDLSFEALKRFTGELAENSIIYLLPYFRDTEERIFPQGRAANMLSGVSKSPIFVSWSFQLNTGTIGGAVVDGRKLGEIGATTLLQILSGIPSRSFIDVKDSIISNIYDYQVIERYHVELAKLPADVRFINQPSSFFDQHRQVIVPAVTIIVLLSVFLLLLIKMWKKETIINQNNKLILQLNKEVIETQRELVATLGEVIETRSQETGNHVKRVARISRFIGEKLGLSETDLEILEVASPLHDVGKIGIPDMILHKPGRLNDEELVTMQKHTNIGKNILVESNRHLLSSACSIAHEHHERWDGTGYPQGLSGESIHIFARITAVADVYDALSSERCYKAAWPEEKVLHYLEKESGLFFDPEIINVFLTHYKEIKTIRESLT